MTDVHDDTGSSSELVTAILPALTVIEVLAPDQFNDVGNGEYPVTVKPWWELTRDGQPLQADGSNAAQAGDVLSVQPDKTLQTRPAQTAGNFERCKKTAAGAVFRPIGPDGPTVLIGAATETPNS